MVAVILVLMGMIAIATDPNAPRQFQVRKVNVESEESTLSDKVYQFPAPTKRLLNKYVKDIKEEFTREEFSWFIDVNLDDLEGDWRIIIEYKKAKILDVESIIGYIYNGIQVVYKNGKRLSIKKGIADKEEPFVEYKPPRKKRSRNIKKLAELIGGL